MLRSRTELRRLGRPMGFVLVLALLLPMSQAQENTDPTCLSRTIVANLIGIDERSQPSLEGNRFSVRVGREQLPVQKMVPASPSRIIILLDTSGSMFESETKWKAARLLASDILTTAPSAIQFDLVTFEAEINEISGFTSNRAFLLQQLDALTYQYEKKRKGLHPTALLDSIRTLLSMYPGNAPGDVIYVITDGDDNRSRSRYKDVQRQLLARQMRLYFFMLRSPEEQGSYQPQDFQNLAYETAGDTANVDSLSRYQFQYVLDKQGMNRILLASHALNESIFQFYLLDVNLPRRITDPAKLEVQVLDHSNQKNKKVDVLYPHLLLPCPLPLSFK